MNNVRPIKRVVLALLATLVGVLVGTAVNTVTTIALSHGSVPSFKELPWIYLAFLAGTAGLGVAGWIVAVVLLVCFADTREGRFWIWLVVGTLIGPLSVLVEARWLFTGQSPISFDLLGLYTYASVDAFLTTFAYLHLLRGNDDEVAGPPGSSRSATEYRDLSLR